MRRTIREPELIVAQQHGPNGADLYLGKLEADASVTASPEGDPLEATPLLQLAGVCDNLHTILHTSGESAHESMSESERDLNNNNNNKDSEGMMMERDSALIQKKCCIF